MEGLREFLGQDRLDDRGQAKEPEEGKHNKENDHSGKDLLPTPCRQFTPVHLLLLPFWNV
jgi:hypothetical protein